MKQDDFAVPPVGSIVVPTPVDLSHSGSGRCIATRDPELIRAWATRHRAEPATGEATASGPATVDVRDGGVGIRFNFPGAGRYRPISWDEWLAHFERYRLVFVYEEETADRAYSLWQERGANHGGAREDWFEAERQLRSRPAGGPIGRYWFVQRADDRNG
jgi:hypothetical protein